MAQNFSQGFYKKFNDFVCNLPPKGVAACYQTKLLSNEQRDILKQVTLIEKHLHTQVHLQEELEATNLSVMNFGQTLLALLGEKGNLPTIKIICLELEAVVDAKKVETKVLTKNPIWYLYLLNKKNNSYLYAGGNNFSPGGQTAHLNMGKLIDLLSKELTVSMKREEIKQPVSFEIFECLKAWSK